MDKSLFPVPKVVKTSSSRFDYSRSVWIRTDPAFSPNLAERVMDFRAGIEPFFSGKLQVCMGVPEHGAALLEIIKSRNKMSPQHYKLEAAPDRITLEASDEAGAFYGLQTLRQLIETQGPRPRGVVIEDWPDFQERGVMIDVSRAKVPTMETLFGIIELLASLKINQIQLYTEHTFSFSAHQGVWAGCSPVTAEEIMGLDAFCRARYIELVPNFNSFGHFGRWLKFPEYKHMAECPAGFENPWGGRSSHGTVLKPSRESLRFLDSLYSEFLPNFSSKRFNVGCDETWELGQGWSKRQCEKRGATRVYLDFLLRINRLVNRHGRRMMFWGDIIIKEPELVRELPRDAIALEWGYEAEHPFKAHGKCFRQAGIPFHVCPGTSAWNALVGRVPNCMANIENAAENGLANGAAGFLNTDWGDGGHHQYLPFSYPGYFYGAAKSWNAAADCRGGLCGAMSRMALKDGSGVLAAALLDAGGAYLEIKKPQCNSTVFNQLLFSPGDGRAADGISTRELKKSLARLEAIGRSVTAFAASRNESAAARDEILNALAMAALAVKKGLMMKKNRAFDEDALGRELRTIIDRHERLWLMRNRVGGLGESLERLRNALK